MKKIKSIFIFILICVAGYFTYNFYTIFFEKNTNFESESIFLKIPSNSSFSQILDSLSNYLVDIETFEKAAKRKKYSKNIKAGRFLINSGDNNNDIVNSLRSSNIPLNLTFNNIETLSELAGKVSKKIEADSVSIMDAFTNKKFLNELSLTNESVFSLFIPNTYQFFWNTKINDFSPDDFILSINSGITIWKWFEAYFDFGLFKNKKEPILSGYDTGLRINIIENYLEVFFPVYSSNGSHFDDNSYSDKIRFVFTFDPENLTSLFTRRWF